MPYLGVSQLGEQATGQQQVDHDPGGQDPDPALRGIGPGQGIIDHVKRHELRQFTEVAGREPARRRPHRASYGNLCGQRSSWCEDVLE